MAEYLLEAGIPAVDVVPENEATTTRENLRFSRAAQEKAGRPGALLVAISNEHRVLNAVMCLPFFANSGFIVLGVLAAH